VGEEVKMKILLTIFLTLFGFLNPTFAFEYDSLSKIPIQDGGRVKPFDTFANESLQLIYGKKTYNGKPAAEVVFTWFLIPEHWTEADVIQIRRKTLKEALKLKAEENLFKVKDLLHNDRLPLVFQDLENKQTAKEKLDPYFQDVARLRNQLGLFHVISNGEALRFVPPHEGDRWLSVSEFTGDVREKFIAMTQAH
jgi:hypothetical protein